MRRYGVSEIRDDTALLRDELHELAAQRGGIVNVIWQPPRRAYSDGKPIDHSSGYLIISEFER
jgi:hypothetical protein